MKCERIRKEADSLLEKLVDHAVFIRAVYGKGRLGKVDSLLGRGQGYCARFLGEEFEGVDLREFLAMLVALKVDVQQFFADALAFHPERFLWRLEGAAPDEVRYLKRQLRWARKDRHASDVERAREQVPTLEERRMLDRAAVKQECIQALGALSQESASEFLELLCEAIGVLGAICRTQGSLSSASLCLREALGLASRLAEEDSEAGARAKARTLQRVACVVADVGEFKEGLGLVESARELYWESRDEYGVGKTLVDSGTFFWMLGRFGDAAQDFERSLRHLPRTAWRYRFTAFQGLGLCHEEQNESKKALGFLGKAEQEVRGTGSEAMAHWLLWLRGRIRVRNEEWMEAETDFRTVREMYLRGDAGSPLDLALISLELAKLLLIQGKPESLRRLTQEMMPLMGRFETSPMLAAAIERYLLTALRGEISIQTIDEAYRKLKDASQSETSLLGLSSIGG